MQTVTMHNETPERVIRLSVLGALDTSPPIELAVLHTDRVFRMASASFGFLPPALSTMSRHSCSIDYLDSMHQPSTYLYAHDTWSRIG